MGGPERRHDKSLLGPAGPEASLVTGRRSTRAPEAIRPVYDLRIGHRHPRNSGTGEGCEGPPVRGGARSGQGGTAGCDLDVAVASGGLPGGDRGVIGGRVRATRPRGPTTGEALFRAAPPVRPSAACQRLASTGPRDSWAAGSRPATAVFHPVYPSWGRKESIQWPPWSMILTP